MKSVIILLLIACLVSTVAFMRAGRGPSFPALRAGGESNLKPRGPRLNLVRGLLQGGAALVTGLVVSQNMPRPVSANSKYPIIAEDSAMNEKGHGTSEKPVQKNLKWGCDNALADRICNFNRHWAENAGYWQGTNFITEAKKSSEPITFYDSVTGVALFKAPVGRTMDEFLRESQGHGWPSFRDEEVVWENVRCLKNGEAISTTGTHLGHNLPDRSGNRYCINLVSVAGSPEAA